ncbi:MAG: glycosyltransferase family 4 protein [Candidatus Marinimicrobia bacterium]|nr:glycosyltransferase family 4 protein [Candidatus Neomarinimicrobiota bacterium]
MRTAKSIAILHFAAPPTVGGVEKTLFYQALTLIEMGYSPCVVSGQGRQFHSDINLHRIPEMYSQHPKVLAVNHDLSQGKVTSKFYELRDDLTTRLNRILAKVEVAIVHNVLTLHKNLALSAALWNLTDQNVVKIIAWCHDIAWQDELYTSNLFTGYPWNLLKMAWPGVKYVTVSEDRRKDLSQLIGLNQKEIAVVNPGVDIENFMKLELATKKIIQKLDLMNCDPLMLLPVRITRRKNIELALKVTAELRQTCPQVGLVVTGPPGAHNQTNVEYWESLRKLRAELNLTANAHFLFEVGKMIKIPKISDGIIADLYRISDLLLFPSRREGFGIPTIEAGLSRLPIFSADLPPVRESTLGFASYFDPDDAPGSVAETILDFLKEDHSYQFKHRVVDEYSWRQITVKKIIPLIKSM